MYNYYTIYSTVLAKAVLGLSVAKGNKRLNYCILQHNTIYYTIV